MPSGAPPCVGCSQSCGSNQPLGFRLAMRINARPAKSTVSPATPRRERRIETGIPRAACPHQTAMSSAASDALQTCPQTYSIRPWVTDARRSRMQRGNEPQGPSPVANRDQELQQGSHGQWATIRREPAVDQHGTSPLRGLAARPRGRAPQPTLSGRKMPNSGGRGLRPAATI